MPRPLPSMPRALPSMPRALPSMPRALPSMPRALPSMPRALPSMPRALPSMPRPLPSMPRPLPSMPRALPSMPRHLTSIPPHPRTSRRESRNYGQVWGDGMSSVPCTTWHPCNTSGRRRRRGRHRAPSGPSEARCRTRSSAPPATEGARHVARRPTDPTAPNDDSPEDSQRFRPPGQEHRPR
jgi:hypothetical protein